MRHLHHSGANRTVCGVLTQGGRCLDGARSVHTTKARRSDCPDCRKAYRYDLNKRHADGLRAAAQRTEFEAVARRLIEAARAVERRCRITREGD